MIFACLYECLKKHKLVIDSSHNNLFSRGLNITLSILSVLGITVSSSIFTFEFRLNRQQTLVCNRLFLLFILSGIHCLFVHMSTSVRLH
jgi:hypothetical protein